MTIKELIDPGLNVKDGKRLVGGEELAAWICCFFVIF